MELGSDQPVALPHLKAAVTISEACRRAVLCHGEDAGGELFEVGIVESAAQSQGCDTYDLALVASAHSVHS